MKYILDKMSDRCSVVDSLDGVYLSASNRERAKAYMRKADMVTRIVIQIVADVRAAVAWIERGVAELARRIRTMIDRPARN